MPEWEDGGAGGEEAEAEAEAGVNCEAAGCLWGWGWDVGVAMTGVGLTLKMLSFLDLEDLAQVVLHCCAHGAEMRFDGLMNWFAMFLSHQEVGIEF